MADIKEFGDYCMFTTPAELHKAINTLKGLASGIITDLHATNDEIQELAHWCVSHQNLRERHPFNELIPLVENAYQDGILDTEEIKDIIWLCNSFTSEADYYDLITSNIQYLSGLIYGIMSDGILSDDEIKSLHKWIDINDYLRGVYPFDELESLLSSVLSDGKISSIERDMLQAFFSNFIDFKKSYNLNEYQMDELKKKYHVDGICARCPDIKIENNLFCFTGQSYKSNKKDIADIIKKAGGQFNLNLNQKTNYLIVGSAGSNCWAYACYGRKIEEAIRFRKKGIKLVIVNELDFWDSLEDIKSNIE